MITMRELELANIGLQQAATRLHDQGRRDLLPPADIETMLAQVQAAQHALTQLPTLRMNFTPDLQAQIAQAQAQLDRAAAALTQMLPGATTHSRELITLAAIAGWLSFGISVVTAVQTAAQAITMLRGIYQRYFVRRETLEHLPGDAIAFLTQCGNAITAVQTAAAGLPMTSERAIMLREFTENITARRDAVVAQYLAGEDKPGQIVESLDDIKTALAGSELDEVVIKCPHSGQCIYTKSLSRRS